MDNTKSEKNKNKIQSSQFTRSKTQNPKPKNQIARPKKETAWKERKNNPNCTKIQKGIAVCYQRKNARKTRKVTWNHDILKK